MKKACRSLASAAALLTLIACGGGGGSSGGNTGSTTSAADAYPTSLAIASPTSVVSSGATVVARLEQPLPQRLSRWWELLMDGVGNGNRASLMAALRPLIPLSTAAAAPARIPEAISVADYLSRVAAGSAIPSSSTLPLNNLFKGYTAADCYGPRIRYLNHNDGPDEADPRLPGGDLGMWKSLATVGAETMPCAVAQLNALMDPVKSRANASLIMGARLVALALANGGLPAAGSSKDLQTPFRDFVTGLLPTGPGSPTLDETLAGITHNADGSYTYQVRLLFSANRVMAFKITHKKGTGAAFEGLLQYASSAFSATRLASCAGDKTADIGTLRYKSDGSTLQFSAREGPYCVSNPSEVVTNFSSYVALDIEGELDPTKNTRSDTKGWDQEGGGFKRFAASMSPSTQAGDYLFAWQAGTGDSHSRMFAVRVDYDTATEIRGLKAFFGFGDNMASRASSAGKLQGMICNWAGPGNAHTPQALFQRQTATLAASATAWSLLNENIVYAPTRTCNATGSMNYDANGDNVLSADEGKASSHTLLAPTGVRTKVEDELTYQGFSVPSFY